jgi:adenylosuccinate synthase
MPLDIVLGTQWGDEGKGHITDLLASGADYVARFSGGDNAGHTVAVGREIFKLHLIPSGIIQKPVICVLGNGVVINPAVLLREINELEARNIKVDPERLKVSQNAHLITPLHIALDAAKEGALGGEAIGTTGRGIGPAYTDKATRSGLRAGLMASPETLSDAIHDHISDGNRLLVEILGMEPLDANNIAIQYLDYARRLAPYLADTSRLLNNALTQGRRVLAEGAQGTLLDLDHGTYPFVTSSWPTAGGALTGLGIGPKAVRHIVGVAKAFTSRVGSGPFPCELEGDEALRLRGTGDQPWDEYGTTTGRPRRVGWLDTVILRYSAVINSLTHLALTKLDILTGLPKIPVCVAYEFEGERTTHFPTDLETLSRCRPVYEYMNGWEEDISYARTLSDLPENARRYVDFVSEIVGIPIHLISIGPGREQVIKSRNGINEPFQPVPARFTVFILLFSIILW